MSSILPNRRTLRCAIYTRKSTEEGLDQEFNSLDAQREACAAYILSQRHEGWTLVPGDYDDGGFSGGNMERPGLRRLLEDVRQGRVDVIVVYKVDRLTRSLADFAKIVEVLDARGACFVSITQAFNTTTSMGRLTLNVLLSFAQFEREVTGERIRDKIAASKKKGLWMGGPVPLGYDVIERRLVVNEAEAGTVRSIYTSYIELGTVPALVVHLNAAGIRTKVQQRVSGPHRGGIPFARGSLYHLLRNRIYLGEIVHKGAAYPGAHDPIIDADLWQAVQDQLAANGAERRSRRNVQHPSLLAGLLHDGHGRRLSPSHAAKGSKRYRYYITPEQERVDHDQPAWRIPAHDLERLVIDRLIALLTDGHALHGMIAGDPPDGAQLVAFIARAAEAAHQLKTTPALLPDDISGLIRRIDLHDDRLDLALDLTALAGALPAKPVTLSVPVTKLRRGHDVRLVLASAQEATPDRRDPALIRLIADAIAARETLLAMPGLSLSAIARAQDKCPKAFARLVRLGHLAPDIVSAIVDGRQPAQLDRKRFGACALPIDWADQRRVLGFTATAN